MKFTQLLQAVIEQSEIPLRFEPGAEEAVMKPITEMLQAWIEAHLPEPGSHTEFDSGARSLAVRLLAELDGSADLPGA